MSVLRRPPRELRCFLIAVLCLVFACTLFAQSEVMPISTSEPVVTNNETVVSAEASTVEKATENQSAPIADVPDASKATETVAENAPAVTTEDNSNKAISVEVSPADEVINTDSSPAVVLSESIPVSNPGTLEKKVEEKINSSVESVIDNVKKDLNTAETTISNAIKESAPIDLDKVKTVPEETVPAPVEEVKTAPVVEFVPAPVEEVKSPVTEPVVQTQIEQKPVEAVKQEEKPLPVETSAAPAVEVSEKALSEGAEAVASVVEQNTNASSDQTAVKTAENSGKTGEGKANKKPAKPYYFEANRGSTLAVIIVLLVFVGYYTYQAQRGKEMFIRRISGLSAIEDAVGRATEMGRGVLYVPGIMDMDDIQTIAGVTILGHVARKTAEYDTDLYAPMTRSFVMSVAQEVVKQAYMERGRIDAYRPDRINYLTDDQFGYVAGVGGVMMRDKPAACFYLGTFYAESLILAETGNSIGAIQIAGTAEPSQIPFFVAACDYTLIGEELFAASAYLSKNPREVGSLKGQDMVKIVIILAIIVGTILETLAATDYGQKIGFGTVATNFMEFLK